MIRSKCFLSTIFNTFGLTNKEEEVWPDGIHPMLFTVKLCLHAKVLGCRTILLSGKSIKIFVFYSIDINYIVELLQHTSCSHIYLSN